MTAGPRIAVLDYGIGNLRSAEKALAARRGGGAPGRPTPASVEAADAVVLPGVGAFGACARALREQRARGAGAGGASTAGVPFFGVCVGFQLLYEGSVESPGAPGLGVFPGTVAPLPAGVKHPQMQWNTLERARRRAEPAPLRGLGPQPWVYFVHSFAPPVGRRDGRGLRLRRAGGRAGRPGRRCGARSSTPRSRVRPAWRCWPTSCALAAAAAAVMELLPAIDLRGGAASGSPRATSTARRATATRPRWRRATSPAGARWIHVVDLDAARTGVPHERAALGEIVRLAAAASVPVQSGGGVRTEDDAEELLESGVARVVLGTAALEEPALAGRCAAALARAGGRRPRLPGRRRTAWPRPQAQGWLAGSGQAVDRPARRCGRTSRSAPWWPPSWPATACCRAPTSTGCAALLAATALPVVASGGVSGARATWPRWPGSRRRAARLAGAIVGKALVEGRFERGGGGGRVRSVRLIPCLDVTGGPVVKGVRFVDLTDEGDPVELAARYDAEGADEVTFLDITASSDGRDTMVVGGGPHRRAGLHPA